MLLADFKTGWLTVENVSVPRLQAVALALGLNPGGQSIVAFSYF